MGVFTFDKKQAGNAFTPLPIGEYEVIITKTEMKKAQTSQNDMIAVTMTVREDANETGGKRKLFDNLVFTEKAMFKIHQVLAAIYPDTDSKDYDSYQDIANDLLYKYVRVKIKHEADRNDPTIIRERVHYYMPSKQPGEEIANPYAGQDPFADSGRDGGISDDDLPF